MYVQVLINNGDVVMQTDSVRPGEGLQTAKMPGHWVLARLGKRVLRPGGMSRSYLSTSSHNVLQQLRRKQWYR